MSKRKKINLSTLNPIIVPLDIKESPIIYHKLNEKFQLCDFCENIQDCAELIETSDVLMLKCLKAQNNCYVIIDADETIYKNDFKDISDDALLAWLKFFKAFLANKEDLIQGLNFIAMELIKDPKNVIEKTNLPEVEKNILRANLWNNKLASIPCLIKNVLVSMLSNPKCANRVKHYFMNH